MNTLRTLVALQTNYALEQLEEHRSWKRLKLCDRQRTIASRCTPMGFLHIVMSLVPCDLEHTLHLHPEVSELRKQMEFFATQ
jgi:hypothetical protein